jgi:endoglycosylceramidase
MADEITSGWAFYDYGRGGRSPVGGDDLHENPNVNVLVRAYPQRVAGRPLSYDYDPMTRVLQLTFVDVAGVSGATEIYIPVGRFYPNGWRVDVSDAPGTWISSWDGVREVLSVSTTVSRSAHQIRVSPMTTAAHLDSGT